MAPKFALFTKGSKLPLNKGFKNMSELLQSCAHPQFVKWIRALDNVLCLFVVCLC